MDFIFGSSSVFSGSAAVTCPATPLRPQSDHRHRSPAAPFLLRLALARPPPLIFFRPPWSPLFCSGRHFSRVGGYHIRVLPLMSLTDLPNSKQIPSLRTWVGARDHARKSPVDAPVGTKRKRRRNTARLLGFEDLD